MKHGIMAELNHNPPWSIFVETTTQSEVETIMTNLGFGCSEYAMKMVAVDDMPDPCFATWEAITVGKND